MATYSWTGASGTRDWNTAANWSPETIPNDGTTAPTSVAIINAGTTDGNDGTVIITGGSTDSVANLSIGNNSTAAGDGAHLIIGGSAEIGGGSGGGTLIAGTIDITSTNNGGALVGGPGALIQANTINLGPEATLGGGGDFEVVNFLNSGRIQADGNYGEYGLGGLRIGGGTISGPGIVEIDGNSTLTLGSAITADETIIVHSDTGSGPGTGTLILEDLHSFKAALALNDTDARLNLFIQGETITSASYSDGALNITTATDGTFDIPFSAYGTATFTPTVSTMAGYGELSLVVCFARGTRIRTPDGDVAIEQLKAGQRVVTVDGNVAAIKWIGHRKVNCQRHPDPSKVWPVRIQANAFGRGLPCRDLLVSPQHALFVEGVLVPARYLINDRNVVQQEVDSIEYFHIELGCHDILLAEGLPAESYLDTGDRKNFDNNKGPVALHPDFGLWCWDSRACAELKVTGAEVDAVRARLLARARASRRSRRVAAA